MPDPTVLAGIAGAATAAGAVLKTLFDWWNDRGKSRATSEELVREDLMRMISDLRVENTALRKQLDAAWDKMRSLEERYQRQYEQQQQRISQLSAELMGLRRMIAERGWRLPDEQR